MPTSFQSPFGLTGDDHDNALPSGYRLHEFEIISVLGKGGFSIVYLAQDLQLKRKVAIKEYIPVSIAGRGKGTNISVRDERHRETFEHGLRSFINEGQLLASFDHPSLVKVYRFWEQNETAYLAMPFYQGPTLKSYLKHSSQPDEAWLKQLLVPLLDALQIIHADNCFHRDIAPDNILLLGHQLRPLLLDFGAARRVISGSPQSLTVILKPGYAPIEQYAESPSMKQGPWTDVYAVCAVLYMAITGHAPMASVRRMVEDDLPPVSKVAMGQYSDDFLAAIDQGLALRPENRPQNIATLRDYLFSIKLQKEHDENTIIQFKAVEPLEQRSPSTCQEFNSLPETERTNQHTHSRITKATAFNPSRFKLYLWTFIGSITIFMIAIVFFLMPSNPIITSVPIVIQQDAVSPFAKNSVGKSVQRYATVPFIAKRGDFTIEAVLNDIVHHADPTIAVQVLANKERVIIDRDPIRFRIKSSEAGYLYVFFNGTGDSNLTMLFPNALDNKNYIERDTEIDLPRDTWTVDASGPVGNDSVVTMVSRAPRNFAGMGLRSLKPLSIFNLQTLKHLWTTDSVKSTPYAGIVNCNHETDCPTEFGAALIRISEVK